MSSIDFWTELTPSEWGWVSRVQRRLAVDARGDGDALLVLVDSRRPEVFSLVARALARVRPMARPMWIDPDEIARLHPDYLATKDEPGSVDRVRIVHLSREVSGWLSLMRIADRGGAIVRVGETGVAINSRFADAVGRSSLPVLLLRGNARGRLPGNESDRLEESLHSFQDRLGEQGGLCESVLLPLPANLRWEVRGAIPLARAEENRRPKAEPEPQTERARKVDDEQSGGELSEREKLRREIRRLADEQ